MSPEFCQEHGELCQDVGFIKGDVRSIRKDVTDIKQSVDGLLTEWQKMQLAQGIERATQKVENTPATKLGKFILWAAGSGGAVGAFEIVKYFFKATK